MSLVRYQVADPIARITNNDGKVNALSPSILTELSAAFTQAKADAAVVVLTGRVGVFSAGFDLPTLRAGGSQPMIVLRAGSGLAERILGISVPVVIACTGHAIAMGVFLLLCGDYRVGAAGPDKVTANDVAIGLTMPMPPSRFAARGSHPPISTGRPSSLRYPSGGGRRCRLPGPASGRGRNGRRRAVCRGRHQQARHGLARRDQSADRKVIAHGSQSGDQDGLPGLCRHALTVAGSMHCCPAYADMKAQLRQPSVDRIDAADNSEVREIWSSAATADLIRAHLRRPRSRAGSRHLGAPCSS